MKKILRFFVPIIFAFMFLGMLFYLVGASNRALASGDSVSKWWVGKELVKSTDEPQASLVVNTLLDELNSNGNCSLREATEAANTNTAVDACPAGDAVITDTITFEVGGTILLTDLLNVIGGGPLVIDGANLITINGGGSVQLFVNSFGADLTLKGLSLVDGYSSISGGGIFNNGKIIVNDCTLSGNSANEGGGINNWYDMRISNSTLSGNSATTGGSISNSGTLTITISTLSGNIANNGGGINNMGVLTVDKSTLNGNHGRAIFNSNTMKLTNSTLSGNFGSAILNAGTITVTNSTLAGNMEEFGGAIDNSVDGTVILADSTLFGNDTTQTIHNDGLVTAINSIIANTLQGSDCDYYIIDGGHNISSDDSCGFDPANGSMPNTDPMLGPLQDNGGPTLTHALLPGSPAIDAGDDAQCPPTDQRGIPRPQDGDSDGTAVCDIGSYELVLPPTLVNISGTIEGVLGRVTYFTATVEPVSTTLPITYVWLASGHPPITETRGLTDTVGWAWEMPGTYAITVTASNIAGSVMDTHSITITASLYDLYLPLVIKSNLESIGYMPSFFLPGSGALMGLIFIGVVRKWKARG